MLWTAGQRVNPNSRTRFVWKENFRTGSHEHELGFTNWGKGEPNWDAGGPRYSSCINLWPKLGYTWNDQPCHTRLCFVCEL